MARGQPSCTRVGSAWSSRASERAERAERSSRTCGCWSIAGSRQTGSSPLPRRRGRGRAVLSTSSPCSTRACRLRRPSSSSPSESLTVSPLGTYYAVTRPTCRALHSRRGRRPASGDGGSRAVAWSPDERARSAVATEASVYVFTPARRAVERLALVANDLDWRGRAQPDASPTPTRPELALESAPGDRTARRERRRGRLHAARARDPGHGLVEPSRRTPGPCRFSSARATRLYRRTVAGASRATSLAAAEADSVDVVDYPDGTARDYPGACAPTWTPDGRLTFIRDGDAFVPTRTQKAAAALISRDERPRAARAARPRSRRSPG